MRSWRVWRLWRTAWAFRRNIWRVASGPSKGMPPARYLTNLRLQSALNELLDTEESIECIARKISPMGTILPRCSGGLWGCRRGSTGGCVH